MDRRAPVLQVADPQQIASGLQPDRHVFNRLLWDVAENVRFWQGKVSRLIPPLEVVDTATVFSRGISQVQDSDGLRWLWHAGVNGEVHRYNTSAELITTLTSFVEDQTEEQAATFVDFVHWGNWTLLNSGLTAPVRYKPDTGLLDTFGAPQCLQLLKKRNQLFAIGVGDNGKVVQWSDADDIEEWDILANNLAGDLPIEELDTPIRAASKLGSAISVYADDQLAVVYWVGAPYYYGQDVKLDGIGAVGKMAVCADGPFNYGVSRNGVWRTDGQSFQYIDEGVLSSYLEENVNWGQSSKIIACRNDVRRSIEFHFPMQDSLEVSEAWGFDPATGGWSKVVPFQMAAERKIFTKPLGASGGKLYLMESSLDRRFALNLETKPLMVQGQNYAPIRGVTVVDEVEFFALEANGVQFSYGVADFINGNYSWSDWLEVDCNLRTHRTEMRIGGVFHKLRFRSYKDDWDINLQGFNLYGSSEGTRDTRR